MEDEDLDVAKALSNAHDEILGLKQALQSERNMQRELKKDMDDLVELVVYLETNLGDVSRELDYCHRNIRNVGLKEEKEKKRLETMGREQIYANHGKLRNEQLKERQNREVERKLLKSLRREVSNLRSAKNELLEENAILNDRNLVFEEIINGQRSKLLHLRQRVEKLEKENNECVNIDGAMKDNFQNKMDDAFFRGVNCFQPYKWKEKYEGTPNPLSPIICTRKEQKYRTTSRNMIEPNGYIYTNLQTKGNVIDSIKGDDSIDMDGDDKSVLSVDSCGTDTAACHLYETSVRLVRDTSSNILKKVDTDERQFRYKIQEGRNIEKAKWSSFHTSVFTGLRCKTKKLGTSSAVIPIAINDVHLNFRDV